MSQFALFGQRRFAPFFWTQALAAFNDNAFRNALLVLVAFQLGLDDRAASLYTNLAPALFILPFFLFSATAGQIAEKLEKSRLIRITTAMEIGIMSVAAAGFVLNSLPVLLLALFLTGVQSTLFGPVKYSILPAVLKPEELTGGNGLVEMGTSMAILGGMLVGGAVFAVAGAHGPVAAGTLVIALALLGNTASRFIPRVEAAAPELRVHWNPIPETRVVLGLTRRTLAVRNAVLGVSWFWFFGTMITAQLPNYAQVVLGGDQRLYLLVLAVFSVGTGLGSVLCEKLSMRTVEIGLVPLGAFGMTAFLLDLALHRGGAATSSGLDVMAFLAQPGSWRVIADLAGIGVFTGFFLVPLFALIQTRTPREELSRVIAGTNIKNAGFIVLAAVLGVLLQRDGIGLGGVHLPLPGLSIPQLFLLLAVVNAAVALWIFSIVPEFLMRFLSWLLVRALYRLRLHGIEANVPDDGPALLVCNHVSYMDALVLAASIPRPVRFVMYYRIFNVPGLNWIFRQARAIPIAGAREDPELLRRALEEVDAALAAGELVGIFPEGGLTADGNIAPFKTGLERMLATRPVPVVPMALRGMWASMWSRRDSRLGRMRVPRRFRAHVEVMAAPPIAGAEATAALLEARVRELRGDAA